MAFPRIKSILKVFAGAAVLLVMAGVVYEQIGRRQDRIRFPQIGRSVDIGGRSLNIFCSGEGQPAVILDTGGSAPGYENLLFQKRVAQFTRACWFDRAGLGWSDSSSVEQTPAAIAEDLHALLHAAGVAPPYILVGASFSGFNVRAFAGKYPSEVAGAVMADSAYEDQYGREPRATLAPVNKLPRSLRSLLCTGVPFAASIGLVRLLLHGSGPRRDLPPGFTAEQAATLDGLRRQPKSFLAAATCDFEEKVRADMKVAGNMGDIPLVVLSAGLPFRVGDPETDKELVAFHDVWVHDFQARIARLSTRGRQVIVENSDHSIDPEAVLKAIQEILAEARESKK